jgi:hypothetical protein
MLGYVGKKIGGSYEPFYWNSSLPSDDVEISDEVFFIQREIAEAYKAGRISPTPTVVVGLCGGPVRLRVSPSPISAGSGLQ